MKSLFYRRMDNLVNGGHIERMFLFSHLAIFFEFKGLPEFGDRIIELELRLIIKGVKGGLGIYDAFLRKLLRTHSEPGIRHIRNRLKLEFINHLDG